MGGKAFRNFSEDKGWSRGGGGGEQGTCGFKMVMLPVEGVNIFWNHLVVRSLVSYENLTSSSPSSGLAPTQVGNRQFLTRISQLIVHSTYFPCCLL